MKLIFLVTAQLHHLNSSREEYPLVLLLQVGLQHPIEVPYIPEPCKALLHTITQDL